MNFFRGKTPIIKKRPPIFTYEPKTIYSPLEGIVVPLQGVKDDVFAQGILGGGVGIEPSEGKVFSPVSGKVSNLFPTHHAIGLLSDDGMEILIHVGIDTASMEGDGFLSHVKLGDAVTVGQPLLDFDIPKIKSKNLDTTTMVILSNESVVGKVHVTHFGTVHVSEKLMSSG